MPGTVAKAVAKGGWAKRKKKAGSGRSLGGSLKGKKKAGTRLGGARRVKKKAGMQLGGAKPKRKRRTNPWLVHVKKTMSANKGLAFKAILKKAKASYKKK